MINEIKNDHQLDQYAASMAAEIIAEISEYGGDAHDLAHESVDSCEHVIYYSKAHSICQNCNTDNGEAFVEDVGVGENPTYDSIATLIAYGELHARVMEKIEELTTD